LSIDQVLGLVNLLLDTDCDEWLIGLLLLSNEETPVLDVNATSNIAQIQEIGDRCFAEEKFEAAKILFTNVSNWARLASTLVMLEDYQSAVDCARKANATKVWKEVNAAAVSNGEYRLAQTCALNLIIHAEELEVCENVINQ
jgi:hypothetical protein